MAKNTTSQDWAAKELSGRLSHSQGCWIKYRLNLSNITYKMIAREAGIAYSNVSDFVAGRNKSETLKTVICKFLGFRNFAQLLAAVDEANELNEKWGVV